MDDADRAYQHAHNCIMLLENGWHRPEQEQELKDQIVLAKAEGDVLRIMQMGDHWSDRYKTEEELWITIRKVYTKETLSSACKVVLSSTLGWCWKRMNGFTSNRAGLEYTGKD